MKSMAHLQLQHLEMQDLFERLTTPVWCAPEQFFPSPPSPFSPWLRKLAQAQLDDILSILCMPSRAPEAAEASAWLESEAAAPCSFVWCCRVLQLEPDQARRRLLARV